MYLKNSEIYLIVGTIAIIVVFLAFCPIQIITINNQLMFKTFFNLKFDDASAFAAIVVGIITVLVSSYYNNKTYKSTKLASIPTNSANLLVDLEYIFNEYEIYKKNNDDDVLLLLLQVLTYWKQHQKVFRLLTPNFYKKFLKIWSKAESFNENDSIYVKNSKYLFNSIIIQLSDIALRDENHSFSFVKPKLVSDDEDIESVKREYIEFNISKKNILYFIHNISGPKTKKETENKFLKFYKDLDTLFNDLKKEIQEYD